jgi:hypothetical protein
MIISFIVRVFFTQYNGVSSSAGLIILNSDFSVYKTFTEFYYSPVIGTTYVYFDVYDPWHTYTQILNLADGVPITNRKLTFTETNGKGIFSWRNRDTTSEEILPKRLIQELITNGGITIDLV